MNHMYNFLNYLRSLNYSEKTIEIRENAIKKFSKYCSKRLKEINEQDIGTFLNNSDLLVNSQNTYLLSLRQYFKYLEKEFIIFSNPAKNIQCKRLNKLPEVLSEEEVSILLKGLEEIHSHEGKRHRAIFELFYSSGLRKSELLNIKLNDLDLDNQLLRVLGKGNRERTVPFGDNTKLAITEYLRTSRPDSLSDYLFLKPDGKQLTIGALNGAVNFIKAKTGIEFSCHTLRRSCATHLLNNGASPMMIAELLGHQDLKTLSHYLKVSITDLKAMHQESRLS